MKLNNKDLALFKELVEEFLYLHPQLNDVEYDENGIPYEYLDGCMSYDSYGPNKVRELNQLSSKINSLT